MGLNRIVVLVSFLYNIVGYWGPLPLVLYWAHPGNVAGVKSGESGVYYVIIFVVGTVVSSPILGYVAPFGRAQH